MQRAEANEVVESVAGLLYRQHDALRTDEGKGQGSGDADERDGQVASDGLANHERTNENATNENAITSPRDPLSPRADPLPPRTREANSDKEFHAGEIGGKADGETGDPQADGEKDHDEIVDDGKGAGKPMRVSIESPGKNATGTGGDRSRPHLGRSDTVAIVQAAKSSGRQLAARTLTATARKRKGNLATVLAESDESRARKLIYFECAH